MTLHVIISLIAFVSYGGVMALILSQGLKGNKTGQLFFLYIACMLLMQMSYLMLSLAVEPQAALFWYSFTVPITIGQTIVYFFFTRAFLGLEQPKKFFQAGILAWMLAITAFILFKPGMFFSNIYQDQATGLFVPKITELQIILVSPIFILWVLAVFALAKGYRLSRSAKQRVRIQYLLLAVLAVWVGLFANTSPTLRPYPVDVIANIIGAFLIAYAILQHQLLDFQIVIRRGLVFSIPTLVMGALYFLAIFLVTSLFGAWNKSNSLFVPFAVAVIVVAVVTPLRDRAQLWVDQIFFKDKYDGSLMLQRLSQRASSMLDFKELTHMILEDILGTMRVRWAAFLLEQGSGFEPVVREGTEAQTAFSLSAEHPILSHLSAHSSAVTVDTLDDMLAENFLSKRQFDEVQKAGVELLIPLKTRDKLVGVLSLGGKISRQSYTQDDETTLTALANQVTAAIDNARLYETLQQELAERKQVEEQRETLIRELETKNDELERFTYTVSHDLKAPLITIRGFLGYLEEDTLKGNTEQMQADMTRIVEATDKMQILLSELLELSRIGRMMNPPEVVPFAEIVQEAISLARGSIETRGVRIDLASNLPAVTGDRPRLVGVVQNLVDNACKFMGDQPEPRIEIGQTKADEDGHPVFYVRDNGIGIEPQYQERIFELFHKLDAHSPGTGIGLALVKRIVEVHGGRIWVESPGLGKGTSFYFTLPGKE
ncbi:MAG: ATP-binding protein [Anaerolineales bacterium]